jgi:YHS domain-containing protein
LKVPEKGCVICDSTWGNYWEEIEGQRMFFCCDLCAIQFKNLVDEVKRRTGWQTIEEVKIKGDYGGRECEAVSPDGKRYGFFIMFNSDGGIQKFAENNMMR